jgi:DNA-binding response OmpR family regulator
VASTAFAHSRASDRISSCHDSTATLLRRIRDLDDTPVGLPVDRADSAEIVGGLRSGADDYTVKPIDVAVLVARIEALPRRAGSGRARPPGQIELDEGRPVVDLGAAEVWCAAGASMLTYSVP